MVITNSKKNDFAAKKSGADCVKFQSLKAEKYIQRLHKSRLSKKSKNFLLNLN